MSNSCLDLLTDADKESISAWRGMPGTLTPAIFEGPDGTLLAGLSYQPNPRGEEEWGLADLRESLTGRDPRRFQLLGERQSRISICQDRTAIAAATGKFWGNWNTPGVLPATFSWGEQLHYHFRQESYATSFVRGQGLRFFGGNSRVPGVTELRALAKERGIRPLPRKRADLIEALAASMALEDGDLPWPGWFRYGDLLVLRADSGPTQRLLLRLMDAVTSGTLGVCSSVANPYSRGIIFYDTRDEPESLIAAREREFDEYDAAMAAVQPVSEQLQAAGWRIRWLDHPLLGNGSSSVTYSVIIRRDGMPGSKPVEHAGRYTLEELASLAQ